MTAGGTLDQDLGLRLGRNPPPAGHQGPQGAAGKGGIPNHQHQDRGCLMMTGQTLWCPRRGTAFLPLGPKAGGVLSLPASVRLCVCLSVCPSVCLSVCLSVRPYDHACPRDNSKNIFQIFSKLAWNILWVNISDKFDDGYRSSLNMRIIDQKVTLTFFEFLK